jgi:hypothetical protein
VPRSRLHRPAEPLLDLRQQAKAGAKFQQMLEWASKPWPEALKAVTGEDKIDATAMLDYFAPLKTWLDEQNKQPWP